MRDVDVSALTDPEMLAYFGAMSSEDRQVQTMMMLYQAISMLAGLEGDHSAHAQMMGKIFRNVGGSADELRRLAEQVANDAV